MDLVIFDLDGTLIDSEAIILEAQVETFARCGRVHPGREAGLGIVGLTLDIALMRLADLDRPDDRLTETYKEVFGRMRVEAETDPRFAEPLYPGVEAMLDAFAARPDTALAIATGKSRRGVDYIVERHGWGRRFASVQCADDAPSKPHPGMILRALSETGVVPDRAAMIGDSVFDMEMAVAAGVSPIAVAWGFQPVPVLKAHGAVAVAQAAGQLPGIVDGLLPRAVAA